MIPKRLLLIALAAAAVLAVAVPPAASQTFTVKTDITVAAGETQDNVFSLGGNVVVDGRVRRSVIVFGGSITISGEVGDAVVGLGSRIVLKPTAVVNGDVAAIGGTLEKDPGCTVHGDTVYFQSKEIGDKIFREGLFRGIFGFSLSPFILIIRAFSIFVWLVIALVGAGLFPKPIAFAAGEIRRSFWTVFGIGVLAVIAFTGLVIFAAILSIVLIGIPVLFALIAAGVIIKCFGRLAVFYFFGDSLLKALRSNRISPMGATLLGLLVVAIISFIPIFGFFALGFLNVVGWGAAIRTKFGTTTNWFQRKPPQQPCA